MIKAEHKHLGMILDSKLTFLSHIEEAIVKARRGIGIIRFLFKYITRDVLDYRGCSVWVKNLRYPVIALFMKPKGENFA